ncbi:MAG: Sua5/YciO/YrdC/YwlC family protein [Calditrichota bacterium]
MVRQHIHLKNPHNRIILNAAGVLSKGGLIIYPTDTVYGLVRHCSPGPYTFILPSTREIPKNMLSKRKEIGIRIPDSEVCHALIENLGHPIATTSVNIDPAEILNSPDEIENRYQNQVDLMLDADWLPDAHESTVVSLIDDDLQILRKGKGNIQKLYE